MVQVDDNTYMWNWEDDQLYDVVDIVMLQAQDEDLNLNVYQAAAVIAQMHNMEKDMIPYEKSDNLDDDDSAGSGPKRFSC